MSYICAHCGRQPLANTDTVILPLDKGGARILCKKCAAHFGTCFMCQHSTYCGFHEDPDPMPQFKVIARQIQQGNTTFIQHQQIPNPDRVKKFCMDGKCQCFLDDPEHPLCCRHGGYATCTNYCERTEFKFSENFSTADAPEN